MAIVFTDTFTASADTPLLTHNINYVDYWTSSPGAYIVRSATGRCDYNTASTNKIVGITGAGIPTGDQEVRASCGTSGANPYDGGFCAARVSGGSTANAYVFVRNTDNLWELVRHNAGSFSVLATYSVSGFSGQHVVPNTGLRVTGTGATVSITPIYNGTALATFNDTSASRLTSGVPGFQVYHNGSYNAANFIDNFVVDDLVVAGGTAPSVFHNANLTVLRR